MNASYGGEWRNKISGSFYRMHRRATMYDYNSSGASSDDLDSVFESDDIESSPSETSEDVSDDGWDDRVRRATSGEATTETNIRKAMFQQNVSFDDLNSRKHHLMHSQTSQHSVRRPNTVLPMTLAERASDDLSVST